MAAYSYKRVAYRDDFSEMEKTFKDRYGEEPDGDPSYIGDNWVIAADLLESKDEQIAALRTQLADAAALRDSLYGDLAALRAQLAEVTRERDEAQADVREYRNLAEILMEGNRSAIKLASELLEVEARADLAESRLAEVTREAVLAIVDKCEGVETVDDSDAEKAVDAINAIACAALAKQEVKGE